MQSSKIDRIKDLVEQLNAASESYYAKDQEIMSNYEYDKLYDELVELEGTTVSRASVHNISIMRSLRLGIGDHITVYKANMIIPQIAENLTGSCLLYTSPSPRD